MKKETDIISHVVEPGESYLVTFVNNLEEGDEPLKISFVTTTEKDTKAVIEAISAFYSGDDCQCFINGEEAVLDRDWGLKSD